MTKPRLNSSVLLLVHTTPSPSRTHRPVHNPAYFHYPPLPSTSLYPLHSFYLPYNTKPSPSGSISFLVHTTLPPSQMHERMHNPAYFHYASPRSPSLHPLHPSYLPYNTKLGPGGSVSFLVHTALFPSQTHECVHN